MVRKYTMITTLGSNICVKIILQQIGLGQFSVDLYLYLSLDLKRESKINCNVTRSCQTPIMSNASFKKSI